MKPKLRLLNTQIVNHEGQPLLLLQDRQGLAGHGLALAPQLAPLLALCDGTRSLESLRATFALRTGVTLPLDALVQLFEQLDSALMLESPRFFQARDEAIAAYRALPHRPLSLAGTAYPDDPDELAEHFAGFAEGIDSELDGAAVRGVVCPHIDYRRGGRTYARTWARAAAAVREAEVVIAFGTDHSGGPGTLTLTRQRYATPWGALPLATDIIEAMAGALGEEAAFGEELNHQGEHSLELALNWLHFTAGGRPLPVAPILCGSFYGFTRGEADPSVDVAYDQALSAALDAARGRRLLVVVAADLAHVGPAFDDPSPLDSAARLSLRAADEKRLAAAASGDAAAFLAVLREEQDCHKVCGLPPIYFALRLLTGARGEVIAYEQCPAEEESLVSIAGLVYS